MLNSLLPADQLTLRMFGDEKAEKAAQGACANFGDIC
jgi:hypothetical protein